MRERNKVTKGDRNEKVHSERGRISKIKINVIDLQVGLRERENGWRRDRNIDREK